MLDPFTLTGRMIVAMFAIIGYVFAGICESLWYLAYNRRDRIGYALGGTLRAIVDAIACVFRR